MQACGKAPLTVPEPRPIQIQRTLPASRAELKDPNTQKVSLSVFFQVYHGPKRLSTQGDKFLSFSQKESPCRRFD